MGHGQRTEVENTAVLNRIYRQFLCLQHHICSGIPVKGEIPVSVGKGFYKCQCRMDFPIHLQIIHADACVLCYLLQLTAEHIVADLPDKRTVMTQFFQHSQNIARCTTGICFHKRIALFALTVFCKINEQLSESNYIKTFRHHSLISRSYFSTSTRTAPSEAKLMAVAA